MCQAITHFATCHHYTYSHFFSAMCKMDQLQFYKFGKFNSANGIAL